MTTAVLATTNPNKVREIRALLDGVDIEVIGLDRFAGIEPPEETGATFEENAALKARYYAAATGLPAIAEDSGLEIDALDGQPGVESARFGGVDSSYPEKFEKLYAMLDAAGGRDATARFVCALALVDGDDPPVHRSRDGRRPHQPRATRRTRIRVRPDLLLPARGPHAGRSERRRETRRQPPRRRVPRPARLAGEAHVAQPFRAAGPQGDRPPLDGYSQRSASSGSVAVARRAGK